MTVEIQVGAGERLHLLDEEGDRWLSALMSKFDLARHSLGPVSSGPLLLREEDGSWRAGNFVADLRYAGRRLTIGHGRSAPAVVDMQSIAWYAAALWCRAVDDAGRHGPPAIHSQASHIGASLRGRLDTRATIRLRARGSSSIASSYRARQLDNPVSRALVAADRVLRRQIGHDRWRTQRVREILPRLQEAVGRRSAAPTLAELARIQYSPITAAFRDAAEMSCKICTEDPIATTVEAARPQGLVIDLHEAARVGVSIAR